MKVSYHKSDSKFSKDYSVNIGTKNLVNEVWINREDLKPGETIIKEGRFKNGLVLVSRVEKINLVKSFFTRSQAESYIRNNK